MGMRYVLTILTLIVAPTLSRAGATVLTTPGYIRHTLAPALYKVSPSWKASIMAVEADLAGLTDFDPIELDERYFRDATTAIAQHRIRQTTPTAVLALQSTQRVFSRIAWSYRGKVPISTLLATLLKLIEKELELFLY